MYRLPYSKNDNPNGWIEVTTYCNMSCAGCYKGIDREDSVSIHEDFEKIKSEILELKRIRNCGIITISGGEALMHPNIIEIVSFVKALKLDSFIHTNGILLKKPIVEKLKAAGLTGFIVRVDIHNRPTYQNEESLHKIRTRIANFIDEIGGLQLGFTSVITKKNLQQIPDVINWFQANHRKTDYLVLILKREFVFVKGVRPDTSDEVSITELAEVINSALPDLIFSSYLGNESKNIDYKWLESAWISHGTNLLGYVDAKMVEFSTIYDHFTKGNYSYANPGGRKKTPIIHLIAGSFLLKAMRTILWQYIISIFKKPNLLFKAPNSQVINIVNPPGLDKENEGFCDSCPDAVLYDGELQASCILESKIALQNSEIN